MRKFIKSLFTLCLIQVLASSCQTGKVVNASTRPIEGFEKQKGTLVPIQTREIGNTAAPQLYVKKREVEIKPKEEDTGGSLYKRDDGRNSLFTTEEPVVPGSYVTVEVTSNYVDPKRDKGAGLKQPAKTDKADDNSVETAMLKAIPDLEPADKDTPIVKRFRMKVTHHFDNGDLGVVMKRESTNFNETQQLLIKARIPYMRLVSGENLKTSDLVDVDFHESTHGEVIDRTSSGWEDEYSLRLSGFDESKSKLALDLEEKRLKLLDAAQQMKTTLRSMSDERKAFSKQREDLMSARKKAEDDLATTKKQMDDQNKELEKLKPKEEGDKDKKDDGKNAEQKKG